MTTGGRKPRIQNIWLVVLAIFFLGILVAGLWMTGRALDLRLDEVNARVGSEADLLRAEIAKLRRDVQTLSGRAPQPIEPPAEPVEEKVLPGEDPLLPDRNPE